MGATAAFPSCKHSLVTPSFSSQRYYRRQQDIVLFFSNHRCSECETVGNSATFHPALAIV